jgi:hypothetical protein
LAIGCTIAEVVLRQPLSICICTLTLLLLGHQKQDDAAPFMKHLAKSKGLDADQALFGWNSPSKCAFIAAGVCLLLHVISYLGCGVANY